MTHWEERLFSLGESSFFNLIKNYILNLDTPYNKQNMIQSLSSWLGKEENQSAIIGTITEEEREILSVIYHLKDVPYEKLPLTWNDEIRENMEERLLIFRKIDTYGITPILEQALIDREIISFSVFLELSDELPCTESLFHPDDRLFTGFLSCFSEGRSFFLNDGTPRRRSIEELLEKLPYPSHWEDSFFSELAELFIQAGLLVKSDKNVIHGSLSRIESFESLSYSERILYLATLNAPSSAQKKIIPLITHLINIIPQGNSISMVGWNRLIYLIESHPSRSNIARWSELPSRLSLLGICVCEENKISFNIPQNPTEVEKHPLLVQPNGDIDAPPHTPFSLVLALSCSLESGETYYRFRMTKESFERGMRKGIRAEQLINGLEKLTGRPLPGNLITTIGEWETHLSSLRIVPGILLNITGYPLKILEQSNHFLSHVVNRIETNWFLMNSETKNEWQSILKEVGLNPFEEINTSMNKEMPTLPETEPMYLPTLKEKNALPPVPRINKKKELLELLTQMNLREEWEKELHHRIDRGVILFPEQLTPSVLRQESCKAGGLDFNSKLRLITSTLDSRNPQIEIKIPQSGSIKTILVKPLEMHNSREESVILYRDLETDEENEIAVRKILEVIKFHGSLLS